MSVCVCTCMCVCVHACVCVCVCVCGCVCVCVLRIVSMDKILCFTNTLIIVQINQSTNSTSLLVKGVQQNLVCCNSKGFKNGEENENWPQQSNTELMLRHTWPVYCAAHRTTRPSTCMSCATRHLTTWWRRQTPVWPSWCSWMRTASASCSTSLLRSCSPTLGTYLVHVLLWLTDALSHGPQPEDHLEPTRVLAFCSQPSPLDPHRGVGLSQSVHPPGPLQGCRPHSQSIPLDPHRGVGLSQAVQPPGPPQGCRPLTVSPSPWTPSGMLASHS